MKIDTLEEVIEVIETYAPGYTILLDELKEELESMYNDIGKIVCNH